MGIHLGRVGHIGIHVSDVDRSIDFYRRVLGLKLTGRWGPPDIGRPICFMRIDDKHHDVVLFELPEDARRAGVAVTDSSLRRAPGLGGTKAVKRRDFIAAVGGGCLAARGAGAARGETGDDRYARAKNKPTRFSRKCLRLRIEEGTTRTRARRAFNAIGCGLILASGWPLV